MTEDIYPMPFFLTLIVSDVAASARFYQAALGFKLIFTLPGPGGQPALVHLRWVKYADLLLARPRDGQPVPEPRGAGVALSFNLFDRFGGDIQALADHARQHTWRSDHESSRQKSERPDSDLNPQCAG